MSDIDLTALSHDDLYARLDEALKVSRRAEGKRMQEAVLICRAVVDGEAPAAFRVARFRVRDTEYTVAVAALQLINDEIQRRREAGAL